MNILTTIFSTNITLFRSTTYYIMCAAVALTLPDDSGNKAGETLLESTHCYENIVHSRIIQKKRIKTVVKNIHFPTPPKDTDMLNGIFQSGSEDFCMSPLTFNDATVFSYIISNSLTVALYSPFSPF